MHTEEAGGLVCRFAGEVIRIEPWGLDALRVRARPNAREVTAGRVEVLLPPAQAPAEITIREESARITNGRIGAEVRMQIRLGAEVKREPVLRIFRTDTNETLLEEARGHFAGPSPRAFRALAGDSWRLEASFAAQPGEKLYGLGQPQHGLMDLKGVSTTLVQQNTHVVVPFILSSRGYGFLWHNPATGRAEFATNITRWTADATSQLDYWVVAGNTPAEILSRYADATGHSPNFPEWASGFWQCKLRYRTQEELLSVAREYRRRGLPLSCIVIDFFHWTRMGEWRFDPAEWPDPDAMMRELRELGVETMVSVWPTVQSNAETWPEMRERGFLMRTERGAPVTNVYPDKHPLASHFCTYYDATNPEARAYVWDKARQNYLRHGIANFWIDSCEPELRPNHPEQVRLLLGNGAEVLNAYPHLHIEGFREGLKEAGHPDGVLLVRSAWAGSQRHGVILWSGDVWSTWRDFRAQITAGLHAGLSGLGWWTTDIGGFYEGIGKDPGFRELLVRWFQFGVFSPVCRLHGFRVPDDLPLPNDGVPTYGDDTFRIFTATGGANEVWSYGEELYRVFVELLFLRERIRPYLMAQFAEHARTGAPVMRPLFFDFPGDAACWDAADSYMLGPDLLVAPVVEPGARSRGVHLPRGARWRCAWTGAEHDGGSTIEADAPLDRIPLFLRDGAVLPITG
jgi:alpha-D-xyloside xylohydrolase